MTYDDAATPREKKISRALAVGMHVAFLVLLIFGVSWQKRYSEPAAVVDLWSNLPSPHHETVPPAPKPVTKVEPKPQPRPQPKPEVKHTPKPDIALKEKLEKERKAKEQEIEKRKHEFEKKKEEEAKKLKAQQQAEAKKKEDETKKLKAQQLAEAKKKEEEKRAAEAEAKRAAADKQALADKLAKEQAAAQSRLFNEYIARIQNRIRSNIVEPPGLQGNPQVEFEVRLLPGGDVLESSLRMRRSSGNAAYDQAVERAILKSSPLPLPPDPGMFNMFRELNLKIRPRE